MIGTVYESPKTVKRQSNSNVYRMMQQEITGASNARGVKKITIFDQSRISEMMQDRATVNMEGE